MGKLNIGFQIVIPDPQKALIKICDDLGQVRAQLRMRESIERPRLLTRGYNCLRPWPSNTVIDLECVCNFGAVLGKTQNVRHDK